MKNLSLLVLILILGCTTSSDSFWKKKNSKDDFGDEIEGEFYYSALVPAKVNNEQCDAHIMRHSDFIGIVFTDKDSELVQDLPSRKFINTSVKIDEKAPVDLELFIYNNMLTDGNGKIDSLLKLSQDGVKILVDLNRVSSSLGRKYVFEIRKDQFFSEFPN